MKPRQNAEALHPVRESHGTLICMALSRPLRITAREGGRGSRAPFTGLWRLLRHLTTAFLTWLFLLLQKEPMVA